MFPIRDRRGRTLGFGPSGLGALLAETVRARQAFQTALAAAVPEVRFLEPADANIVCFSIAARGDALSDANRRTAALFDQIHHSPDFSVSKTTLGPDYAAAVARHVDDYGGVVDAPGMVLIRCVFMNPYWAVPGFRAALFPSFIALVRDNLGGDLEAAA